MVRSNEDKIKKIEKRLEKIAKKLRKAEKKLQAKELKRKKKLDKAKLKETKEKLKMKIKLAKVTRPPAVVVTPLKPTVIVAPSKPAVVVAPLKPTVVAPAKPTVAVVPPQITITVTPPKPAPLVPSIPVPNVTQPKAGVPLTKALLIGINYNGSNSQLYGCINDMDNLSQKLVALNLIKRENMTFMTDNLGGAQYPTKANILTQFDSLVQYAIKNPQNPVQLLIAYSGHGTYMRDTNRDEADGRDEALCPVDYSSKGFITDDDLNQRLLAKLPVNAKLVMLVDACNSGTMGDLKYNYKIDGLGSVKVFDNYNPTTAEIVMVSGCTDAQTSADAYIYDTVQKRYEYQGAMTASFLATFLPGISSSKLITGMRDWLARNRMTQTVQFSSGKSLVPSAPFLLTQFRV